MSTEQLLFLWSVSSHSIFFIAILRLIVSQRRRKWTSSAYTGALSHINLYYISLKNIIYGFLLILKFNNNKKQLNSLPHIFSLLRCVYVCLTWHLIPIFFFVLIFLQRFVGIYKPLRLSSWYFFRCLFPLVDAFPCNCPTLMVN